MRSEKTSTDRLRFHAFALPVPLSQTLVARIRQDAFKKGLQNKKTGKAGIFAGSLELVKEGNITIKQNKLYDDIYIKEIK